MTLKNKQSIFFLAGLLVIILPEVQGQPAIQWQKCYGGTGNEGNIPYINTTTDGGFIVAGLTYSNDGDITGYHGTGDCWVFKTDSLGTIQWEKSLGGTQQDIPYSIMQTNDGGFIVSGETHSNDGDVSGLHDTLGSNAPGDAWVVKLDTAGNIQWQKCLGGYAGDAGQCIQQTTDQGYILAGYTYSNDGDVSGNHGGGDYWVVKLDNSGNIQWQKCYGGTHVDFAFTIKQTLDAGYIVGGRSMSTNGDVTGLHGNYDDGWILKIDSVGALQWQKCLGGTAYDYAYDIYQNIDSSYMIAMSVKSNNGDVSGNHGGYDAWIAKLDVSGALLWQKCYGGSYFEFANSIERVSDGRYVIGCSSESNDSDVTGNHSVSPSADIWVVKIDSLGNLLWQKCLGGLSEEFGGITHQTPDKGYIIAGTAWSANNGDVSGIHLDTAGLAPEDFWLVKLAPDIGTGTSTILDKNSSFTIYPNPAKDEITISNWETEKNDKLEIFNLLGEKIVTGQMKTSICKISIADLKQGVYFIKAGTAVRKFVKE